VVAVRILLTGANGFIGRALLGELMNRGFWVAASHRGSRPADLLASAVFALPEIDESTQWMPALTDIDVVVHTAGRVHVVPEDGFNSLEAFRKVNVAGTLNLARQAAQAAVRRFVFISSIKVNGEESAPDVPFSADGVPAPQDAYGISKYEAEQGLLTLAAETGMEVVIIRPVLVYGPEVKANFRSMMSWLLRGVPLPLGAVHNKRSLVALDNLVDLVMTCIVHRAAVNQVFLASDGEDISTTDLLRRVGSALGKPARLLPVPGWVLEFSARLIGRQDLTQRLCGNLQVDITKTRELLGWKPPVSMDEGLRKTSQYFLEHQAK
jgi:UDP-glucose 4-epimerase